MKALYPMTLRVSLLFAAALIVLQGCPVANGQDTTPAVGPVGDNVQPPQPGVGHDYIRMMSETVDPAKGSLSVRINFPAPKGRGITVPDYADYNSGQLSTLIDNSGSLVWATAGSTQGGWGIAGGGPLTANGGAIWSITTPTDSAGDPTPPEPNSVTPYTCSFLSGLSFTDLNGTNHTLPVGASFPPTISNSATTNPNSDQVDNCSGSGTIVAWGDTQVSVSVPTMTGAQLAGRTSNLFAVSIMDKDGNTTGTGAGNGLDSGGWEDRNGNQLGYNPTGGGFTGEMDTAGRPLALNGWGPVQNCTTNTTTETMTCTSNHNGLNYTETWGITPVNYTPPGTFTAPLYYTNGQPNYTACPAFTTTNGNTLPTNSANMYAIQSITLPNGQMYQFSYDPKFGTMTEIVYPNGGWVKYTWGLSTNMQLLASFPGMQQGVAMPGVCSATYETPVVTSRTVSYDGKTIAQTQTFTYNTGMNTVVTTTDVARSVSNSTSYTYTGSGSPALAPFTNSNSSAPEVEQTVTRTDWQSSTVLDTETKAWYNVFQLACEFHTNVKGLTSGHFYQYSHGLMVDDQEFDFTNGATAMMACTPANVENQSGISSLPVQPPTPIRETVSVLVPMSTTAPASATVSPENPLFTFYKPASVTVYSGGAAKGTPVALTTYSYDEYPVTAVSGLITSTLYINGVAYPGEGVHDEINFGPSKQTGRGNVTTINKLCLTTSNPSCTPSTTHFTYDETGQVTSMTDGLGNLTKYSYTDSFTTANNDLNPDGAVLTGQTNAYLTSITNALGQTTSFTYDWMQGDLIYSVDPNKQTTTYLYLDSEDRPTETDYPDQGKTMDQYNDSSSGSSITSYKLLSGTLNSKYQCTGVCEESTVIKNGVGQAVQTIQADPENYVYSEATYDGMGRVWTKTNPHRQTASTTDGSSTTYYDALGRPTMQVQPDGTKILTCYDGVASLYNSAVCKPHIGGASANVTWVDTQDESGNQWQRSFNGLGQMIQVEEPNGTSAAPTMETDYTYDVLNNLMSVTQQGNNAANTSGTRVRSFTYNSLSQLVTSINPETGIINYLYDADGNLFSKTDARGITVKYQYDPLNRLLAKTYYKTPTQLSGDPASCYQYDVPLSGVKDSYPIGRLTAEWTAPTCPEAAPGTTPPTKSTAQVAVTSIPTAAYNSTVIQAHDPMGRTWLEAQCPYGSSCGSTYQFSYIYDKAGNITSFNNGMPTATSSATAPALNWGVSPLTNGSISAGQLGSLSIASFPTGGPYPYASGTPGQPAAFSTISGTSNPNPAFPAILINAPASTSQPVYDPLGHLVNGQFALNASNTGTAAIYVARSYDNRGRILNEADSGQVAAFSLGQISLSGTEAGPLTAPATSGSGTLTITGSDGSNLVCTTVTNQYTTYTTCTSVPDTGSLSVTIDGFTSSASYASGTADASIASALAAGFNVSGSPVTAVASGFSLTVTAIATGTASNYPISINNGGGFTISDPNTTLAGGHGGGSAYDAGTATVTLSGGALASPITTASVSWGQGDTTSTLAVKLAAAINTAAGSYVTATANSANINLTSTSAGAGTDYAVSVSIADTQTANYPTLFAEPSFSASADNLTGGENTASEIGAFYSWQVGSYAPNGNILSLTDSVIGPWSYTYDTLNRLTGAIAGVGNIYYANETGCFQYDAFGNRTLEAYATVNATPCTNQPPQNTLTMKTPQGASYNNQLASAQLNTLSNAAMVYDSAGNVTNDGRNLYFYDGEGRLCAVAYSNGTGTTFEQYLYDASGTRVAKGTTSSLSCAAPVSVPSTEYTFTLTNQYLLDLSGDQVTELTGTGAWVHSNAFSGGRLTATYDLIPNPAYTSTNGQPAQIAALHYAFSDPLGTKRVQEGISSTGAGIVELNCLSLPFGNDIGDPFATHCVTPKGGTAAADATEHHFTGKERDTESGNDYFGARYYSSAMGRWMSPDWSAKEEPLPYSQLGDPQSLNLYAYVFNNPITGVDPTGHAPFSFGGFQDCHERGDCGDNLNTFHEQIQAEANAEAGKVWDEELALAIFKTAVQDLADSIPDVVKEAIMSSVNASNSPSGADLTGGFHEEGGIWGTNADGSDAIVPATPGAYCAPGCKKAHITPADSADPALKDKMTKLGGEWHVHPKGGSGREFEQEPSPTDKSVAGNGAALFPIHIVVGAGNSRVYFYNESGVTEQMKLSKFLGK